VLTGTKLSVSSFTSSDPALEELEGRGWGVGTRRKIGRRSRSQRHTGSLILISLADITGAG